MTTFTTVAINRLDELQAVITALTQFIENQPDLDPGERLADEIGERDARLVEAAAAVLARAELSLVEALSPAA